MRKTYQQRLLFSGAFLLSAPAWAQDGFDAHGFTIAAQDADLRGLLALSRPASMGGGFFIGGLLEYAEEPLMVGEIPPGGDLGDVVELSPALDNLWALNLSLGYAPNALLRFDVAAPMYLSSVGLDGNQGAALGDLRLAAMVSPLRVSEDGGLGVGISPFLDLPTGQVETFRGDTGLGGGVRVAATGQADALSLTANAGLRFRPAIDVDNLNGADEIELGLGAGYLLSEVLHTSLEAKTSLPLASSDVTGSLRPAELLPSLRYRPRDISYIGGAAIGLSRGASAAAWRLFLGATWAPTVEPEPEVVDTDGDGLFDDVDACVTEPEVRNDYRDDDGCPDALATLSISATYEGNAHSASLIAANGPRTESGPAPLELTVMPGSSWSVEASYGACLSGRASLTTVEGANRLDVPLAQQRANLRYVVEDPSGKPIPGATVRWEPGDCVPGDTLSLTDGKGAQGVGVGSHRLFVSAPEYGTYTEVVELTADESREIKVVLKPTKVRVEEQQIVILDIVYFEFDSDVIKPESYGLLKEVAATILAHPNMGRIEVAGHTDEMGPDDHNLELSQRRAESVRKFLIEQGVAAERLVAKGYGETKPIASNASVDGRAKNRRVEFTILEKKSK